jgi:peroxiredoxin
LGNNLRSIKKVGDSLKDFGIRDQHDKAINLPTFKGKRVLLLFHPLAWINDCAKQIKSLEKNWKRLESLNTIPVRSSVTNIEEIIKFLERK